MKRIGFFKAIAGGVAALAGFKPVTFSNIAVNSGKTGVLTLAKIREVKKMLDDDKVHRELHMTRLQKAIHEESTRMQKHIPEILEERHKVRMKMLGLNNENKT